MYPNTSRHSYAARHSGLAPCRLNNYDFAPPCRRTTVKGTPLRFLIEDPKVMDAYITTLTRIVHKIHSISHDQKIGAPMSTALTDLVKPIDSKSRFT